MREKYAKELIKYAVTNQAPCDECGDALSDSRGISPIDSQRPVAVRWKSGEIMLLCAGCFPPTKRGWLKDAGGEVYTV